jgi:SpoVK/Ycf46/Vps4 family AAA+-type ATPase
MELTLEDLHHRLDQLRFLATQTDDPLADRLVRDLIVELEDRLTANRIRASEALAFASSSLVR